MLNLSRRIFTSLPLLVILYMAMINQYILFCLLFFIFLFSLIEILNIIKKILKKKKLKILFFFLISLIYLSIFLPQLYFYIGKSFSNKFMFIYFVAICIATDVGGYIFGKLFRGKKLTIISPNKTYSGLLGSYILSLSVFTYFFFEFNLSPKMIIFTIVISTISQIGDLFISFLKRKAKIKDTGNLLPGHGGILDRIDGIIFAVPISINLLFLFK